MICRHHGKKNFIKKRKKKENLISKKSKKLSLKKKIFPCHRWSPLDVRRCGRESLFFVFVVAHVVIEWGLFFRHFLLFGPMQMLSLLQICFFWREGWELSCVAGFPPLEVPRCCRVAITSAAALLERCPADGRHEHSVPSTGVGSRRVLDDLPSTTPGRIVSYPETRRRKEKR